jgi:NADH:ubiquinone oxidoreductase subunit E
MSHGPSATACGHLDAADGHSSEPYVPVFTGETKSEARRVLERYPTKMAALLPALWMVQEARAG